MKSNKINVFFFILLETGLAPTTIFLNSTTSGFSVFWNNPSTHFNLVSDYKVSWRVSGSSSSMSGSLGTAVNQYTVSSGLMSGQLYIVNIISYATLSDPTMDIVVNTNDHTVRLGMNYDIQYLLNR